MASQAIGHHCPHRSSERVRPDLERPEDAGMKRVSDRLSRLASLQEQQAHFWQFRQAILGPRRADTVQEVEWQRHGDRCLPRLHRGLLDMKYLRRRHPPGIDARRVRGRASARCAKRIRRARAGERGSFQAPATASAGRRDVAFRRRRESGEPAAPNLDCGPLPRFETALAQPQVEFARLQPQHELAGARPRHLDRHLWVPTLRKRVRIGPRNRRV